METETPNREKLCKDIVNKIFKEAEKLAKTEFKGYPEDIRCSLELFLDDDRINELKSIRQSIIVQYKQNINIGNIKKAKNDLVSGFVRNSQVIREDFSLDNEAYPKQIDYVKNQFLRKQKIEYLNALISDEEEKSNPKKALKKIKWLGTPSEFGVLIHELVEKGYIEKEKHKRSLKKESWTALAKLCSEYFFIPNQQKDGETSAENLRREINSPSVSDKDHQFFKITRTNRG